jgi:hypothetical protein
VSADESSNQFFHLTLKLTTGLASNPILEIYNFLHSTRVVPVTGNESGIESIEAKLFVMMIFRASAERENSINL